MHTGRSISRGNASDGSWSDVAVSPDYFQTSQCYCYLSDSGDRFGLSSLMIAPKDLKLCTSSIKSVPAIWTYVGMPLLLFVMSFFYPLISIP